MSPSELHAEQQNSEAARPIQRLLFILAFFFPPLGVLLADAAGLKAAALLRYPFPELHAAHRRILTLDTLDSFNDCYSSCEPSSSRHLEPCSPTRRQSQRLPASSRL